MVVSRATLRKQSTDAQRAKHVEHDLNVGGTVDALPTRVGTPEKREQAYEVRSAEFLDALFYNAGVERNEQGQSLEDEVEEEDEIEEKGYLRDRVDPPLVLAKNHMNEAVAVFREMHDSVKTVAGIKRKHDIDAIDLTGGDSIADAFEPQEHVDEPVDEQDSEPSPAQTHRLVQTALSLPALRRRLLPPLQKPSNPHPRAHLYSPSLSLSLSLSHARHRPVPQHPPTDLSNETPESPRAFEPGSLSSGRPAQRKSHEPRLLDPPTRSSPTPTPQSCGARAESGSRGGT